MAEYARRCLGFDLSLEVVAPDGGCKTAEDRWHRLCTVVVHQAQGSRRYRQGCPRCAQIELSSMLGVESSRYVHLRPSLQHPPDESYQRLRSQTHTPLCASPRDGVLPQPVHLLSQLPAQLWGRGHHHERQLRVQVRRPRV